MAHDNLSCDREFLCLSDLSPRDISWKQVKPQSQMTANAYAGTVYDKYYQRMQDCSGWLYFALVPNDSGEVIHKLQSARLCRVRHCPICQWRRSLLRRARAFRALQRIIADYPGKRFIFLTLTAKNCELDQLGETLSWMNESWKRLTERKEFPGIGWLRSIEVTRGKDDTAHPHFHALLMVNANYFGKSYINQKRWRQLWAESLRVDYDPFVNVQVVKPQGKQPSTVASEPQATDSECSVQPMDEGLVKAIRYTLKYSNKPEDFLVSDTSSSEEFEKYREWLIGITRELHRRRSVTFGGIFKDYVAEKDFNSEGDSESLIVVDGSGDGEETEEKDPRVTYVWKDEFTDYLLAA